MGKGLETILEYIKWEIEWNENIKKIIVIIAGNDIQKGKNYCKNQFEKMMKYREIKILSAIPKYSQNV